MPKVNHLHKTSANHLYMWAFHTNFPLQAFVTLSARAVASGENGGDDTRRGGISTERVPQQTCTGAYTIANICHSLKIHSHLRRGTERFLSNATFAFLKTSPNTINTLSTDISLASYTYTYLRLNTENCTVWAIFLYDEKSKYQKTQLHFLSYIYNTF